MTGVLVPQIMSGLLFVVLPALLPVVRRAGPPLLVVVALLGLVNLASRPVARKALIADLCSVPVLTGAAFLACATTTLIWTPWLARGAAAVASGWLIFGSFVALASHPAFGRAEPAARWLAPSISFGAALVALDLRLDVSRLWLGSAHAEPFRYNMVIVSLVLLFCACLRVDDVRRPATAAAAVALLAAVSVGESETAKLALAMAVMGYLVAHVLPRKLLAGAVAVALVVVWFGFFWLAPLAREAAALLPGLASGGHAAERLQIWTAFTELAIAGMPWGWGVESVAMAPALPFFTTAPDDIRAGLDWMHPHNNVIQIAAEMGLPGVGLGCAASLSAAWWIGADARLAPARAALAAAILTVALVSHGFWQVWFWSTAAVGVLALRTRAP
jgi:O-antigen ligase